MLTPACHVCGSQSTVAAGRQAGHDLALCRDCRLVFVSPQPDAEAIARAYASGTLIEENGTEGRGPDGRIVYPPWKRLECERIVDRLIRLAPGRSLLDVGCLWGLLLETARRRGFEVTGVEPWSEAAAYCRELLGLQVFTGGLEVLEDRKQKYDVIALLDVIEHCGDPLRTLRLARQLVVPGGVLCLTTPNVQGLIPRLGRLKRRAIGREEAFLSPPPPFHLFGFGRQSLRILLARCGFDLQRIQTLSSIDTVAATVKRTPGQAAIVRLLSALSKVSGTGDRMFVYSTCSTTSPTWATSSGRSRYSYRSAASS